jgi:hypothetical protein
MPPDATLYVSLKAFIRDGERVLILNDPRFGLDFPRGKLQPGEVDLTAALRGGVAGVPKGRKSSGRGHGSPVPDDAGPAVPPAFPARLRARLPNERGPPSPAGRCCSGAGDRS